MARSRHHAPAEFCEHGAYAVALEQTPAAWTTQAPIARDPSVGEV